MFIFINLELNVMPHRQTSPLRSGTSQLAVSSGQLVICVYLVRCCDSRVLDATCDHIRTAVVYIR